MADKGTVMINGVISNNPIHYPFCGIIRFGQYKTRVGPIANKIPERASCKNGVLIRHYGFLYEGRSQAWPFN